MPTTNQSSVHFHPDRPLFLARLLIPNKKFFDSSNLCPSLQVEKKFIIAGRKLSDRRPWPISCDKLWLTQSWWTNSSIHFAAFRRPKVDFIHSFIQRTWQEQTFRHQPFPYSRFIFFFGSTSAGRLFWFGCRLHFKLWLALYKQGLRPTYQDTHNQILSCLLSAALTHAMWRLNLSFSPPHLFKSLSNIFFYLPSIISSKFFFLSWRFI